MTPWVIYGSGVTTENGITRRMRQLILWGKQVLASTVFSGAVVGATQRGACGRLTAAGTSPTFPTTLLASAVRVQEEVGKRRSRQDGLDRRRAVSQAQLLSGPFVSLTHQPPQKRVRKASRSLQDRI
jgi:hypothetical protein